MQRLTRDRKVPFQLILIVPFTLQLLVAVGLTGYFSWRNGQQTVKSLATQLIGEVSDQVEQQLDAYLSTLPRLGQISGNAIESGLLDFQDLDTIGQFFWQHLSLLRTGYISFGTEAGEFIGVGHLRSDRLILEEISPRWHGDTRDYVYGINDQGNRTNLIKVYDPYAFQSFLKTYGYCREEVIGRTSMELGICPNAAERHKLVDRLQTEKQIQNVEVDFLTKEREVKRGLFSIELIELDGQLCLLNISKDITDRCQTEAALRESEERFQAFMKYSPVMAWIDDVDGQVIYVNQTYLQTFQIESQDVVGKTIFDLYPPDFAQVYHTQIQKVVETQQAIVIWENWSPHLILMDMQMPIMDGYAATQWIKSRPQGQSTCVIALTAAAFQEQQSRMLEVGCETCIYKPFRSDELMRTIAKFLNAQYSCNDTQHGDREANKGMNREMNRIELQSATTLHLNLDNMPPQWKAELHHAASLLKGQQCLSLIDQIADEHAPLAEKLKELVSNFRFDLLLDVTQ